MSDRETSPESILASAATQNGSAECAGADAGQPLDEWRSRYEFLTEALPQFVWIGDADGNTEFVNQYWYDYTGMSRGEDLNRFWPQAVHPADLQATLTAFLEGRNSGRPYSLEFRVRRASDHAWRWHMARHQPVREPGRGIVRWIATAIDIDDRRRAEEIVRENEERTRIALAASSTGVWRWDFASDRFTRGQNMNRLLGLEPVESRGTLADFLHFVHDEDRGRLRAAMDEALRTGGEHDIDVRVVRIDGAVRWLRDQGRVVRDSAGEAQFMTGACVDITERKLAAEVLARQAQQLARSNADLQHFAYITSHDLQEPLRMISSFSELLARRYADKLDEEANEYIGFVVNAAKRMSALIRDLLSYSRLVNVENVPLSAVDAGTALNWALMNLQVTINESGAEITSDPMPHVMGDQVQLVQLFQNLIGNAIKYRGDRKPRIHVGARREGGYWRISVQDNGIGIAPEYHDRIFGVFKRLHGREYPGTGIGLAICKAIVERHEGRISVESKPGEGSVFYFTVPAA